MIISIIAAMDKNRLIGKGNSLPWDISGDLRHFKELTMGKTLIMGSRTFESIGKKPLKGRKFIVLDNNPKKEYNLKDCKKASSIEQALRMAEKEKEVMVAGGSSVYKQFLPLAEKMYLTIINNKFEGDVYFPDYNINEWEQVNRVDVKKDSKNIYEMSFLIFKRKK